MRVVVQVVKNASITIENELYSSIDNGFLLFVGFTFKDNIETIKKVIDKIISLRIFPDQNGKTNMPFDFQKHEILCVSQFTLYANVKHSRRPSFTNCLTSNEAKDLYLKTLEYLKQQNIKVKNGVFGVDMKVNLLNDGPFTLFIDSEDL